MMNNLLEKKIREYIQEESNKIAQEVIDKKTQEARREIADKVSEVVAKATQYVLVNSFEDLASLKTIVQIELNKVVILDGKR